MSSSIIEKPVKNSPNKVSDLPRSMTCSKCGGNGYVKTSPTRYHTCLDCFGKGYKNQENFSTTIK